jgi:3-hydroxyacyl-[acyl-carrier-protein] dehydratase
MKFALIDRIVELQPRQRIVAVKAVSLAEEYLADHFPTFPVLPGVLMLETMAEAGAWLVRDALEFEPSVVLLKSARNVTYKSFVKPGRLLRVEVDCRRLEDRESEFSGTGFCDTEEMVRARFTLTHFRLADREPALAEVDVEARQAARSRYALIRV